MELNEIAKAVHENNVRNGFVGLQDHPDAIIEAACNNLHDEVSELHTAWRNGELYHPCDKSEKMKTLGIEMTCLEEEIADIIIRALDLANRFGLDAEAIVMDKHNYNVTRPYRHGDKKS